MSSGSLSGSRKAAALFVVLGEEISSQVLKFFYEDEIEEIGKEMALLENIPMDTAESLLQEFESLASGGRLFSSGGPEYTKKLLNKALGPDASRRVLEKVTKSLETSEGFEALDKTDPQQMCRFIQDEQPQTIALILAHVDPRYGAVLLASLPENLRADIAVRIANLGNISPEVIQRISAILHHKLAAITVTNTTEPVGGARAVAELVNKMDRALGRTILETIQSENSELAITIRNLMLVFDDILLVDPAGLRELLQRVDKKTLTLALKGTSEELQTHIFKNMSQRAIEMMKEDMEALGPVRVRDVEKAQREIVEVIQQLEESGVISIRGGSGGGGDDYVV